MNLGRNAFQTYVLRPLLALWGVLALGMLAAVVIDAIAPEGRSTVAGFFKYRANTASAEWAAVAEAERLIRPEAGRPPVVEVDTDNGIFFYLLRYRLYPVWVTRTEWLERATTAVTPVIEACAGGPRYTVTYRKGSLAVERVQP